MYSNKQYHQSDRPYGRVRRGTARQPARSRDAGQRHATAHTTKHTRALDAVPARTSGRRPPCRNAQSRERDRAGRGTAPAHRTRTALRRAEAERRGRRPLADRAGAPPPGTGHAPCGCFLFRVSGTLFCIHIEALSRALAATPKTLSHPEAQWLEARYAAAVRLLTSAIRSSTRPARAPRSGCS